MLVVDWLKKTERDFIAANLYFGHGTDNAWDEAVALLRFVLKLPPDVDRSALHLTVTPEDLAVLENLTFRRVHLKIPVPYLIQEAWFCGLPFYVDERVIIPRSPMAELIEKKFKPWIRDDHPLKILDLCAGSGCIGLAAALAFPSSTVDLLELSDDAIDVCKMNITKHHLDDRVQVLKSNLFSAVPDKKYDLIVSNPPYVDREDMRALPDEFRYEPTMALAAGEDGLVIVDSILKEFQSHLNPGGLLIVEVGNSDLALKRKYRDLPFVWLSFERGGSGVFLLNGS